MPTPNLNLPTIDRNMFADVPRDMNALAYAVDDAVGPNGKIALRQDLQSLNQTLINHINDNLKHPTPVERAGWNKAVVDIGDKNALATQNKGNLVLAINELFQSSSDKNAKIAAAITEKGVPTSPTATGDEMAANVLAIETGVPYREGTATPSSIGIPFTFVNGTIENSIYIQFTLPFNPKVVTAMGNTGNNYSTNSIYDTTFDGNYSGTVKMSVFNTSKIFDAETRNVRGRIDNNGNGTFTMFMPVMYAGIVYTIRAFG
ncbi:hypothetical protein C3943_17830 [Lysinibacillus sp. B2A1]|nr:hypothetical protein C3943_17830 [Lysinibacillus sp. B2A1]